VKYIEFFGKVIFINIILYSSDYAFIERNISSFIQVVFSVNSNPARVFSYNVSPHFDEVYKSYITL
jgi:hypothetical protein